MTTPHDADATRTERGPEATPDERPVYSPRSGAAETGGAGSAESEQNRGIGQRLRDAVLGDAADPSSSEGRARDDTYAGAGQSAPGQAGPVPDTGRGADRAVDAGPEQPKPEVRDVRADEDRDRASEQPERADAPRGEHVRGVADEGDGRGAPTEAGAHGEQRLIEESTAGDTTQAGGQEQLVPAERAHEYRTRWDAVKGGFVDEPRQAVAEADQLVGELLDELQELFRAQRHSLEQNLDRDRASTEDLRVALRHYRSFFDRLLSF